MVLLEENQEEFNKNMARNTKSKIKIARRLNLAVTDKQQRILAKRNYPPGAHGDKGYPRLSEYGKQLQEKQKAKFIYGILERQFRNYFAKADKSQDDTGVALFQVLERRLDNVMFRAGFAKTREQARQLVSHNHVKVNDKKVNIPSYQVKVGEIITIKEKTQKSKLFEGIQEFSKNVEGVSWLNADIKGFTIKVVDLPKDADMSGEFSTKSVIEFYSK